MERSGVIVSLANGAVQFIPGADTIHYNAGPLHVCRGTEILSLYRSGAWEHASKIKDWPMGLTQDKESRIWVIETPEEE